MRCNETPVLAGFRYVIVLTGSLRTMEQARSLSAQEFWRLAPAFDINPFPERVRELKTWISEDAGPAASIDALMSVVTYFRIANARAKALLRQVEVAVARWREEG